MNIDKRRITAKPMEVLEDIPLDESNLEKFTRIGTGLEKKIKQDLVQFLKKSLDVFTWSHEDVLGGIGIILKSPEEDKLKYAIRLQYQTTNNEVEYEALLKGLELAKSLRAESVVVQGDSQLIINQVNGMCEAKENRMKKYLNKVKRLVKRFKEVIFVQLLREENMEADVLAKEASVGGNR
ncbi:uncharacterized protein LOC142632556 [Castanea sativa]|uniref:uncharacterized protein LOC142632556 n=1 Tax=Castanea sativa TaxID=21020 RepID=UPI003F65197A